MRVDKMNFGVMLEGVGARNWEWLREEVAPNASIDIHSYIQRAQAAEAKKFQFVFIADSLHITLNSSAHYLNRLEPLTMLAAIAVSTSRIGLLATLSTTYTEPFTVARQLASLDLISDGRAGWNVVTSGLDGSALNHSLDERIPIEQRYKRAREHVEVVKGLWDSWEDDAFIYDKVNRVFFDPDKLHNLNHKGEFFSVAGPLNIARSRQGHPVLFQAGASKDGRQLAARVADAIFSGATGTMEEVRAYSEDVRSQAVAMGRSRESIVFMPHIHPIVAETVKGVERACAELSSQMSYEEQLKWLAFPFSFHDFSQYDPDAPFPDLGAVGSESYGSVTISIKKTAKDENLTLRQVASRFALPRPDFIGTPDKVADACERWFLSGAVDGFILTHNEPFYELVIPELQRRGLFHLDYEADTFRGHFGFPPVPNRYAGRAASFT
jgi:N-acetyl-S-(2-succino)cysteine monooxygenase